MNKEIPSVEKLAKHVADTLTSKYYGIPHLEVVELTSQAITQHTADLELENERFRKDMERVRQVIMEDDKAIIDTIWESPYGTLIDFIDRSLTVGMPYEAHQTYIAGLEKRPSYIQLQTQLTEAQSQYAEMCGIMDCLKNQVAERDKQIVALREVLEPMVRHVEAVTMPENHPIKKEWLPKAKQTLTSTTEAGERVEREWRETVDKEHEEWIVSVLDYLRMNGKGHDSVTGTWDELYDALACPPPVEISEEEESKHE